MKTKEIMWRRKKDWKEIGSGTNNFFSLSLEQIIIGITASSNLYLELQIKQKKY